MLVGWMWKVGPSRAQRGEAGRGAHRRRLPQLRDSSLRSLTPATEKFDTLKLQITHSLGGRDAIAARFTTFDMTQYGVAAKDAETEAASTAMLRIFAQAESLDAFGPARSLKTMINPEGLGHFPGFHFPLTFGSKSPSTVTRRRSEHSR